MKQKILIARATFPDIIDRLEEYFIVERNVTDVRYTHAQLCEKLRDKSGAILMGGERIDQAVLDAAPELKAVSNCAAGYNNFDLDALTRAGVIATNTPYVSNESVADMAWALMLAASRRIVEADAFVRSDAWQGFAYNLFLGVDLHGSTLGIIGMGGIGQAIARRATGFGMRTLYYNRSRLPASIEDACHATAASKEDLLRESDHVILMLPYSAQAHHTIGAPELALMKRTAVLVNIARGGIVDDAALAQALSEGRIAAAGLDVVEGEPQVHPALKKLPNVVLTPHIGSATTMTRRALANLAVDNLIAAMGHGPSAGNPPSILNPEVLK
ncbi:MAG: D-glycerate dehydrogenase [Pseudomonadota bacterium]